MASSAKLLICGHRPITFGTMVLTFRYRVKNPAGLLELSRAVNLVWNYCGEVQEHARRWCKRWPSAFDLIQP